MRVRRFQLRSVKIDSIYVSRGTFCIPSRSDCALYVTLLLTGDFIRKQLSVHSLVCSVKGLNQILNNAEVYVVIVLCFYLFFFIDIVRLLTRVSCPE